MALAAGRGGPASACCWRCDAAARPKTVPLAAGRGPRAWPGPGQAARTQPPFDASAMDGYAVRAADVAPVPAQADRHRHSAGRHGFRRQVSARARPCASSPARRCRAAPTRSSSRRTRRSSTARRDRAIRRRREGRHIRARRPRFSPRATRCSNQAGVLDAATLIARRRREPPCDLPVVQQPAWSRSSPPATNWCRPAATRASTRSSHPTPSASRLSRERPAPTCSISASRPTTARPSAAQIDRRRGAKADVIVTLGGASVGDHDLVHEALIARRHDARLLEDRHAARQAADVRPARRARGCSACPAIRCRASSAPTLR